MHRKCSSWTLVVLSTSTALQRMHMHGKIYICLHMYAYVCFTVCVCLIFCYLCFFSSSPRKVPIHQYKGSDNTRKNQEVRMQCRATTHTQIQFYLRAHKHTHTRDIYTYTCRSFYVVAGYHPVLWLPLTQLPATQSISSSLTLSLARSYLACFFFWHIFMRSCVWSINDIYVQFVTLAHVTCRLSRKCLA